MAIRSDISIRWDLSPRLIIIDASSLEITMQDLIDTLRTAEATVEGIDEPFLLSSSGKEDLGSGIEVGLTVQLQNAKVYFEQRSWTQYSGTCTQDNSAGIYLSDASASFLSENLEIGHTVRNNNTGSMATIVGILSDTSIFSLPLTGGLTDDYWTDGDPYQIYPNELCTTGGGNLVAVDASGISIYPILQSPNVQSTLTSSSSATLQSETDLAATVWAHDVSGYTDPNSAGYLLWTNVKKIVNKLVPFIFAK